MSNTNLGQYDAAQIPRRVYDAVNDAIRIQLATGTTFEIAIDSATGDNIKILSNNTNHSSGVLNNTSSGIVIPSFDSTGVRSYQLYGEVLSTSGASTAGNIVARLELSPNGTSFFNTTSTLTIPSGSTTGAIAQGAIYSALSTQTRLSLTSNALVAGDTVAFYLVTTGT